MVKDSLKVPFGNYFPEFFSRFAADALHQFRLVAKNPHEKDFSSVAFHVPDQLFHELFAPRMIIVESEYQPRSFCDRCERQKMKVHFVLLTRKNRGIPVNDHFHRVTNQMIVKQFETGYFLELLGNCQFSRGRRPVKEYKFHSIC